MTVSNISLTNFCFDRGNKLTLSVAVASRERVSGFWREQVQPNFGEQKILLSAHGNTLRALIMEIAQMTVEHIESFEIPTSEPIAIEFDDQGHFSKCPYLRGDQKLMLS